jgi:hypothetical protein
MIRQMIRHVQKKIFTASIIATLGHTVEKGSNLRVLRASCSSCASGFFSRPLQLTQHQIQAKRTVRRSGASSFTDEPV